MEFLKPAAAYIPSIGIVDEDYQTQYQAIKKCIKKTAINSIEI